MLTKEVVEKILPINLKGAATQQLVDKINNITTDPLIAEQIRDNFVSYVGVLKDGKYKTESYLDAVAFVSYKLMGDSNLDAYVKTFPARYANLKANAAASKDIAAYVSSYARGKLVNAILEQSLVPSWVLNQDLYQKAINTQADLMVNSQSDKVRCDAANSLLTHLTKPKEAGPLVNINMGESTGMNEMKNLLTQLAQQQRDLILAGVPTKEIAAQDIIEIEVKNVSA